MTCEPCSRRTGLYLLTCQGCLIRLLLSTPEGEHRKAMGAHVKRSVSPQAWDALLAAWSSRGLPASTPSGEAS